MQTRLNRMGYTKSRGQIINENTKNKHVTNMKTK